MEAGTDSKIGLEILELMILQLRNELEVTVTDDILMEAGDLLDIKLCSLHSISYGLGSDKISYSRCSCIRVFLANRR